MAISRASFENIPINLITAVPSIETFKNVKVKKYKISKILNRFKNASLPNYEIIDLNKAKLKSKSWLSSEVIKKVKKHLDKKDQVLFFLNRRGFSPFVFCKKCLNTYLCPNCSINLVYHKHKKNLLCHYCGFKSNLNRKCIKNEICDFIFSGPGVERIAEEIKKIFPNENHIIFSSDTMNKKDSVVKLEKIIQTLTSNPAKILKIDKGNLTIGNDADFCIVDINKPWIVKKEKLISKSKNTSIENKKLQGKITNTFVKGVELFKL